MRSHELKGKPADLKAGAEWAGSLGSNWFDRNERRKAKIMNARVRDSRSAELPTEQDPRWAAVVARDRASNGKFYYSVETTGVYCRPTCAARLANPKNVRFHRTCADAERLGFRPCKRCKPNQIPLEMQYALKVERVCRSIEMSEEVPKLAESRKNGGPQRLSLSPHFQNNNGLNPSAICSRTPHQTRAR